MRPCDGACSGFPDSRQFVQVHVAVLRQPVGEHHGRHPAIHLSATASRYEKLASSRRTRSMPTSIGDCPFFAPLDHRVAGDAVSGVLDQLHDAQHPFWSPSAGAPAVRPSPALRSPYPGAYPVIFLASSSRPTLLRRGRCLRGRPRGWFCPSCRPPWRSRRPCRSRLRVPGPWRA